MGQALNANEADEGSHLFASKDVNDVLTKQEIFEVFLQHAMGEVEGIEVLRGIRKLDMGQFLQLRSVHVTDSGVRLVVVSEFIFGTTTIDLESSDASDAGFTRG